MELENWIQAAVLKGNYKGKTIEVEFGKPLKILCDGKDITNVVVALRVDLSQHGQIIYLKIAETRPSQFPEGWKGWQ